MKLSLTDNKSTIFTYLVFTLLLVPLFAAAQPAPGGSGGLDKSFAKILNVPESVMTGGGLVWFVIIPWALMAIIAYGILDDIKLFRNGMINFAIAILSTILMIPTNVLGQIIIGIYGGGMTTLIIIIGISILPKFLESFGPRLGFGENPVVLEIITASTYGVMMWFVFGFLTADGAILANIAWWIKYIFIIGVPVLVLLRGYLGKKKALKRYFGSETARANDELKAERETADLCAVALEDLANVQLDSPGGPKPAYAGTDAYNNMVKACARSSGGRFSEAILEKATASQLKEWARQKRSK